MAQEAIPGDHQVGGGGISHLRVALLEGSWCHTRDVGQTR